LAIRAAVAAGNPITYKILFNEAVAMTGGQPIDGALTVDHLIRQLSGEGVKRIALVSDHPEVFRHQFDDVEGYSLHHRDELDALQRSLREYTGCSVLIYQQPCAAEKRRKRKKTAGADIARRIMINEAVCEGCGDCGVQSNCLSIMPKNTVLGRKRQINQHACNLDYSCVKGFCPSFVSVLNAELKSPAGSASECAVFDPLPAVPPLSLEHPWNTVVAGVGGTGVLTVTALIAMAAHIEGKGCATLNQTGLAQKFGAVVSHVRIAQDQDSIRAVRVPAGEADLLIGCDLVVTTGYDTMGKTAEGRTTAIVNDAEQPTAGFLHDPDAKLPTKDMRTYIQSQTGNDSTVFVDASRIAEALLGDTLFVNLFLLGIAFQHGKVPVSAEALDAAIALNGVAVEGNQQAFLLGRRYAVWPEKVLSMLPMSRAEDDERNAVDFDLDALIEDRASRLVDYQSSAFSNRYRADVAAIRTADAMADQEGSATHRVAEQLYRLMAIKDEYEVARLYTSGAFKAQLDAQFEPGYQLQFHLAPPIISKPKTPHGRVAKQNFGAWVMPVFKVLSALRKLRNTPLDPFTWTRDRRDALSDLALYRSDLALLVQHLDETHYATALTLAELPKQLRGFGPVRDQNRHIVRARRTTLRQQLSDNLLPFTEINTEQYLAKEA